MDASAIERFVAACREHLHAQGVPADDLDDAGVVDAMKGPLAKAVHELGRATQPVASWDKRFVRSMAGKWEVVISSGDRDRYQIPGLSPKQAFMIAKLRHKYRRQIPGPVPAWARAASTGDPR